MNGMDKPVEFANAYIACAEWADFGSDNGIPAGAEWSLSAHAAVCGDCRKFLGLPGVRGAIEGKEAQAGHDFHLTRNGLGAGFWDGTDWPEPAATLLTEAAHSLGGCELYQGDDGLIYMLGRECDD